MDREMADNDEILVHLQYLRAGQDTTNKHLEALNSRTRKVENTTAVHSYALGLGGAGALALFAWVLSKL